MLRSWTGKHIPNFKRAILIDSQLGFYPSLMWNKTEGKESWIQKEKHVLFESESETSVIKLQKSLGDISRTESCGTLPVLILRDIGPAKMEKSDWLILVIGTLN